MYNNNNNNDENKSETESAALGKDTILDMPKVNDTKSFVVTKNCCKMIVFLCIVILLSFFTSVLTTKYLNSTEPRRANCINCDTEDTRCCQTLEDVNRLPVSSNSLSFSCCSMKTKADGTIDNQTNLTEV